MIPVRRLLLLLLVVAATGGCTRDGGSEAEPAPPPPDSSVVSTPPASAPPDVATIPVSIDEDYLNRVLAALDEVDGKATRLIVEKKDLVREAADLLAAIYDGEEFSEQSDVWLTTIEKDPGFATFKPNPGNRVTRVARIISRSPLCIWTAVTRDYSEVAAQGGRRREYLALTLAKEGSAYAHLNPTAWVITWDGFHADGSEPEDRCAAR